MLYECPIDSHEIESSTVCPSHSRAECPSSLAPTKTLDVHGEISPEPWINVPANSVPMGYISHFVFTFPFAEGHFQVQLELDPTIR